MIPPILKHQMEMAEFIKTLPSEAMQVTEDSAPKQRAMIESVMDGIIAKNKTYLDTFTA